MGGVAKSHHVFVGYCPHVAGKNGDVKDVKEVITYSKLEMLDHSLRLKVLHLLVGNARRIPT
jgi:hypothetical protein